MKKLLELAELTAAFATPSFAQDVVVVPDPVTTWVTEQPMDNDITIEGSVFVCDTRPYKFVIKNFQDHDDFAYSFVNKNRYIFQPKTRKVVKIIE